MEYKYSSKANFEDLACGRVICHKPGMSNFPVRLAQEIFERALNYIDGRGNLSIYDPCCGSGYLLTVLGLLNGTRIGKITGSDIDPEAVELARTNLSLLSEEGLENRLRHLENLFELYGKESHKEAIGSAKRILSNLVSRKAKIEANPFLADILSEHTLWEPGFSADIVITDVPYGDMIAWHGEGENAVNRLLANIRPVLRVGSIVAVCSDKKQKINSDYFNRLEKQIIGKRKFEILRFNA